MYVVGSEKSFCWSKFSFSDRLIGAAMSRMSPQGSNERGFASSF
jgi:hypothetical protein